MATSGEGAPTAASSVWWKYDAFVSFRGEDTRKSFTDHLTKELDRKGIVTFRDDRNLLRGKSISPELLQAIAESRFAIIVLSKNYASSSWCFDELSEIVGCRSTLGQRVFPIFYDVNPAEVRKQSGKFEEAFHKHEIAFTAEKVQKWRTALTEVANLSGWHLEERHESAFIQEIVNEISNELGHSFSIAKDLVGVDSRLRELSSYLDMRSDDVRFVGICGMGGIGKTAIARVIYDMFSFQFDGSSFVANIAGKSGYSLVSLQQQLLSQILGEQNIFIPNIYRGIDMTKRWLQNKKVLIILDDFDTLDQLETLAGGREWFGRGSRVIITVRDEHLLITHGVDAIYKARGLNDEEALELLSWKAFKQNHPLGDYVELSQHIVNYAAGLPLALKVLGSFLYGRQVNEWASTLKRLKESPNQEIFNILKVSYDGLEDPDKRIFLDISCFFNGYNVVRVTEILDSCDFHAELGIKVLIEKSLLSIDNGKVCVHSLLEEMARVIVCEESPKEPGKRSRLWLYSDIHHVLTCKTGTEAVEIMYLNLLGTSEMHVNADAMMRMHNVRLLKIHGVHVFEGIHFLPPELRILKWNGYPLKSFPSNFKGEKLVELHMSHSNVEQLWKGVTHLDRLRVVKLSHSQKLTRIVDFNRSPNLEKLILEGCTGLIEIHPSIGGLKNLIILNFKDCSNLKRLPGKVSGWNSLKVLLLTGCKKIDKLPENLRFSNCLEELDISRTAITEVPSYIGHLKSLKKLSFKGCRGHEPSNWFQCLLPAIGQGSKTLSLPPLAGLWSLTQLDISDCSLAEGALPNDLGSLTALKILELSKNNFISLPASINKLSNLERLHLEYCQNLQTVPELPSRIIQLYAHNCSSLETLASPLGLCMSNCRALMLNNCFGLMENSRQNVALSLLKSYLCLLVQIRLVSIFPNFSDLVKNPRRSRMVEIALSHPPSPPPSLDIFLPGREIPDWFTYQTTLDTLIMELPPHWCDDHAFLGLALCCVFEAQDHARNFGSEQVYRFEFSLDSVEDDNMIYGSGFSYNRDTLDVCNHLWLYFFPLDRSHSSTRFYVIKNKIKVSFRVDGPGLRFKKCGFRLVFMQDVELNQTMFDGVDLTRLHDLLSRPHNFDRLVIEQTHDA